MKNVKLVLFRTIFIFAAAFCFSENVKVELNGELFDLPFEIGNIVEQNKDKIEDALKTNGITNDELKGAINQANDVYDQMGDDFLPITTITEGLDGFTEDLTISLANTQLGQNVWAEAYIGKFIPGFHIGAGVDFSFAQMRIDTIKSAAKALEIKEMKDLPDTLFIPTMTVDLRLGGLGLPFDIGVMYMSIDSTKNKAIESVVDPMHFDFYTVGADLRVAILDGEKRRLKWSVGAGYAFQKGSVGIEKGSSNASLDFKTTSIYGQTQLSAKLLCFVPFCGVKVGYVKSDVDWQAKAEWSDILNADDAEKIKNLQEWGILPTKFSGGYEGKGVIPQFFAGLGLDFFIVNLTAAVGYDFKNKVFSTAVSGRIAW